MIEQNIPNFIVLYNSYLAVFDRLNWKILNQNNEDNTIELLDYQQNLIQFDSKLRFGMAVREINLNEEFVNRKFGELRECHLMFYKLTDIWFSYETFFKLFDLTFNRNLSARHILWLDYATNQEFNNNEIINSALSLVNSEINLKFNNEEKKQALKDYINYSSNQAKYQQKDRLLNIAKNISINEELPNYRHTEILTLTYAIRNNFVHNGEITIYPQEFNYSLKNNLLKVLYSYLVIVTICSAKITTEMKLEN